jgi:SAM-dependent methyltransferase
MIRPRTLREGTEAHYLEPRYYDQAYRRRRHDVRFYVEQATRFGAPVLELGVGTGRVALALALAGHEVFGIDRMQAMLDGARARLERLPKAARARASFAEGDLRTLRLRKRFPLVISPFNVFMHLYTREDIETALATVRAHLAPEGRFVFDVLSPDAAALARDPGKVYRCGHVTRPEDGRRYRYSENFQYDPVSQIQVIRMIFEDTEEEGRILQTPLAHRQFFPAELEALLHYNGFEIEARYGDFDRRELRGDAESQIIVARARARR